MNICRIIVIDHDTIISPIKRKQCIRQKYTTACVSLCCVVVFVHILQYYLTDIVAIMIIPRRHWDYPDEYEQMHQHNLHIIWGYTLAFWVAP